MLCSGDDAGPSNDGPHGNAVGVQASASSAPERGPYILATHADLCPNRGNSGRICPDLAETGANNGAETRRLGSGHPCPNVVQLRPASAKLARNRPDVGPMWCRLRPTEAWKRPTLARPRPNSTKLVPESTKVGSEPAKVGLLSTKLGQSSTNVGPTSANFDKTMARTRLHLARLRRRPKMEQEPMWALRLVQCPVLLACGPGAMCTPGMLESRCARRRGKRVHNAAENIGRRRKKWRARVDKRRGKLETASRGQATLWGELASTHPQCLQRHPAGKR